MSAHGFWKRGTTVMFDIIIANLDAGSYLCMSPERLLHRRRRKIRIHKLRVDESVEGHLLLWSTLRTEYPEQSP